jgi:hypothetical protein
MNKSLLRLSLATIPHQWRRGRGESVLPDKSAQTGNGSQHGCAALEQEHVRALNDIAGNAADQATVVGAATDTDVDDEFGASGGGSGPGGQPEDDEESIEGKHSNDVVGLVQRRDLLRDDDVGDYDPGEQTLYKEDVSKDSWAVGIVRLLSVMVLQWPEQDLPRRGRRRASRHQPDQR